MMLLVRHSALNSKFILAQTLSFDPTVDINNAYVGVLLMMMMMMMFVIGNKINRWIYVVADELRQGL